jgi:transcriptional regulator with XRE-family HTH domain
MSIRTTGSVRFPVIGVRGGIPLADVLSFGQTLAEYDKILDSKLDPISKIEEAAMAEPRDNQTSSPKIGQKLKNLRKSRGFSIRLLAEKAGVSPNTISLIESNSTSPTVATLQTIANTLEIPLAAFFMNSEPEDDVVLIKAQEQEMQVDSGLTVSVFPGQVLDQRVRIMHFTIAPGVGCGPEPLAHPGDELVLCLQGELKYTVNERTYLLDKQDSLAFNAHLPHRWYNAGEVDCHFLVMITAENDQTFRSHIQAEGVLPSQF